MSNTETYLCDTCTAGCGDGFGRLAREVDRSGMTLEDENARLQAENAALREQMTALVERVQDLEARLAKTATTATSRPPRTDSSANYPGPRSLRRKSGKKPGGQVGCMRYMQAKAWRSRWG